jgi:hypothetical protein
MKITPSPKRLEPRKKPFEHQQNYRVKTKTSGKNRDVIGRERKLGHDNLFDFECQKTVDLFALVKKHRHLLKIFG